MLDWGERFNQTNTPVGYKKWCALLQVGIGVATMKSDAIDRCVTIGCLSCCSAAILDSGCFMARLRILMRMKSSIEVFAFRFLGVRYRMWRTA